MWIEFDGGDGESCEILIFGRTIGLGLHPGGGGCGVLGGPVPEGFAEGGVALRGL